MKKCRNCGCDIPSTAAYAKQGDELICWVCMHYSSGTIVIPRTITSYSGDVIKRASLTFSADDIFDDLIQRRRTYSEESPKPSDD